MKRRPLRQIVDDLERLHNESEAWFQDNIPQRLEVCRTVAAALLHPGSAPGRLTGR